MKFVCHKEIHWQTKTVSKKAAAVTNQMKPIDNNLTCSKIDVHG